VLSSSTLHQEWRDVDAKCVLRWNSFQLLDAQQGIQSGEHILHQYRATPDEVLKKTALKLQ